MLKIKNIKKYFGGIKAVDECTFNVEENSITALIGPNGSGKTTIFNIISGIYPANNGTVIFESEDIAKKSSNKIANLGISRLFQQSKIFGNLTVKENLLLAFNQENTKFWKNFFGYKLNDAKIDEILNLMKLEGDKDKLSGDLSYGQKRLVEIARAIIMPHKLLLLDEPVAGVNPKIRKVIANILLDLKKGGETILLIEHDMNFTLNIADYVIVLDRGKIIAQGSPKEIKNNPKVLKAYLGE